MSKFVFWTGVYNIIAGMSFLFPGIVSLLGVKLPESNFWVWVVASTVIYLGIALVLCSRRLAARASLVYWEGILRIAGFSCFPALASLETWASCLEYWGSLIS